jgi:hypothetical protein
MKQERLLPEAEAKQILKAGQYGVMSAVSPDGAPYGVPLNYYYDEAENAIFFHCAPEGLKLSCIAAHSRVCFTVVTRSDIDAPNLTTHYESAVAAGPASIVNSDAEKMRRLEGLCRSLTPSVSADTCRSLHRTAVVRISVESVSGKRNAPR